MESYASRDQQEEPGTSPDQIDRRVPDRHIITLTLEKTSGRSSGAPVHGRLEVRPGDDVFWEVEVPSESTVGLGLRLPEGVPVRSLGPFAALLVNVADLDGVHRKVEIFAEAGAFPAPSLSLDFAMVAFERAEAPAPSPAEPAMALTGDDPVDPGTSLKIDKMSKPPDVDPRGPGKRFPFFGEGRWQKILVHVAATSEVNLWIDPEPPSGGSNP